MKKIISFVLSFVVVFALCGGLTGCAKQRRSATEILIWTEALSTQEAAMDEFITYFNANNDMGYTLKYEAKQDLARDLKFSLSGMPPDLVMWPRWESATKAKTLLLEDLNPLIERDGIDLSTYNAETKRELTINNKLLGIPTDLDAWGLWVNTDILDAYNNGKTGAARAEIPDTWAQLVDTAEKLTVRNGSNVVTRAGLDVKGLRGQFNTLMLTANANLINEQANPPTTNVYNPSTQTFNKPAVDVMTLVDELQRKNVYTAGLEGNTAFYNGDVAMMFESSYFKSVMDRMGPDAPNMTFIANPAQAGYNGGGEGIKSGIIGGYSLAIPGKNVDKEKSWAAIKWWIQEANMNKYLGLHSALSANTDYWNASHVADNAHLTYLKSVINNYKVRPVVAGYSNFEQTVFDALDYFRQGNFTTIQETLYHIYDKGDAVLEIEAFG